MTLKIVDSIVCEFFHTLFVVKRVVVILLSSCKKATSGVRNVTVVSCLVVKRFPGLERLLSTIARRPSVRLLCQNNNVHNEGPNNYTRMIKNRFCPSSSSPLRAPGNIALFAIAFPYCFSRAFLKQYNLSDAIKV